MESLYTQQNQTLRPISPGAETWLGKSIPCLDHGFVYLVDYMGNDSAIPQAARTSYGAGTKKVSEDEGLIRYLKRHVHTTPFEMVEFKFHCKMPIFVARQWIRHRTANVNEYSGRYSEMINEFYIPNLEQIKAQSTANRQGRGDDLSPETKTKIQNLLIEDSKRVYGSYKELLDLDFARELARIGLSVSNYTEWYWKIDLHNLMHFLSLRLDSHAQYEIRVFAEAMAQIIKDAVPMSYKAFEDYQLHSIKLSKVEIDFIQLNPFPYTQETIERFATVASKREAEEFVSKLEKMKLFTPSEEK